MNDAQLKEFKVWFNAQPDYCSYTRVRTFLSDYLNCSNAKAEIEMAKLAQKDEIKIISLKSGKSGRRVFMLPLDQLTEAHIRSVWKGGSYVSQDMNKIATVVHDRYGHNVRDIKQFMRSLDSADVTPDDKFRWHEEDDDSEEYIR